MAKLRELVSDPRFQEFPIEERLEALKRLGAPQEFIDAYYNPDYKPADATPQPQESTEKVTTDGTPTFGKALGGVVKGAARRSLDLATTPFKELASDFENDTQNWGPIVGPAKTLVTQTTIPFKLADVASKQLRGGSTQAKAYYDKGKLAKATASLIPVVNQVLPAMDQAEAGYAEGNTGKVGEGVGAVLPDIAMLLAGGAKGVAPEAMVNKAASLGKTVAPLVAAEGANMMLGGPPGLGSLLRLGLRGLGRLGSKAELPIENQIYNATTKRGQVLSSIKEALAKGTPKEDIIAEITKQLPKPTKPLTKGSLSAEIPVNPEDLKASGVSMTEPFKPGGLAGAAPMSWDEALASVMPEPIDPAVSATGLTDLPSTEPLPPQLDWSQAKTSSPSTTFSAMVPKEPPVQPGTTMEQSLLELLNPEAKLNLEKMFPLPKKPAAPKTPKAPKEPTSEVLLGPKGESLAPPKMAAPEKTAAANAAGIRAQIDKLLAQNPQGLNARGQALLESLKSQLAKYEAQRTARSVMHD